jgi:hypothetical protein
MKHISEILQEYWERVGICMYDGKLSEDAAKDIAKNQIKDDYDIDIPED